MATLQDVIDALDCMTRSGEIEWRKGRYVSAGDGFMSVRNFSVEVGDCSFVLYPGRLVIYLHVGSERRSAHTSENDRRKLDPLYEYIKSQHGLPLKVQTEEERLLEVLPLALQCLNDQSDNQVAS